MGRLVGAIARLGVRPNSVTVASLLLVASSGALVASGRLAGGACLLALGAALDALDGELARFLGADTPFGGFLDSVCDHCGDFAVYLGLLWFSLAKGEQADAILVFVASFGSVLGSHVRSRAGMLGLNTKNVGLFTRCERTVVTVTGLLAGLVTPALVLLALFNCLSALQRIVYVIKVRRMAGDRVGGVVRELKPPKRRPIKK